MLCRQARASPRSMGNVGTFAPDFSGFPANCVPSVHACAIGKRSSNIHWFALMSSPSSMTASHRGPDGPTSDPFSPCSCRQEAAASPMEGTGLLPMHRNLSLRQSRGRRGLKACSSPSAVRVLGSPAPRHRRCTYRLVCQCVRKAHCRVRRWAAWRGDSQVYRAVRYRVRPRSSPVSAYSGCGGRSCTTGAFSSNDGTDWLPLLPSRPVFPHTAHVAGA
jgi:hypothetical protein